MMLLKNIRRKFLWQLAFPIRQRFFTLDLMM